LREDRMREEHQGYSWNFMDFDSENVTSPIGKIRTLTILPTSCKCNM
jgi:hypothetical protein